MTISAPDAALRLAAIVESSDDGIISKNLTGIITSWNRGAELLFGYTSDEAVGRSITMLIPADRLSEEDRVLSEIRRGNRVEHFETIRRTKDGRLVDVSVTVSPIRDAQGTIIGASKIARNISVRKRVESELQQLQHRLLGLAVASASVLGSPNVGAVLDAAINLARDVFDTDGYAIWRTQPDGSWRMVRSLGVSDTFANRIVVKTAERGRETVPLTGPLVFEDVAASQQLSDLHDAYATEGIASMVVFPLSIHGVSSGTMVFYSKHHRSFPDLDVQVGRALANLSAAALTTAELYEDQRHAREAADHARQQAAFLADCGTVLSASLDYEATLSAVATLAVPRMADWCAIDILNERGTLQRLALAHANPAKVQLARELDARYPPDRNAPGGVHAVVRTGKAAFLARIPAELLDAADMDEDRRRVLREMQLTSYMCVPLMARGKAFGAITFVSAESGREYGESDLRFASELAVRVSLAVENSRAYARAHEANRLKDEFLATLSHELRTPLNAVLGYARMLRAGTLPPEKTGSAFEVIERNATGLSQIIEDVLDVSRIVSGRLRLNVEPVDLSAILYECRATVMPQAEAKGVRVEAAIDADSALVSGDPHRLQQVVWNLLSNAIKFTPRGGKVRLGLSRTASHVEVAVSDTGRGIAPDFLPFVFDRFRQGDSTFSREHGGLGLGLAIARELAELHGGRIDVESDGAGKGATFTVRLPVLVTHESTSPQRAVEQLRGHRENQAQQEPPRLDGLRVLAVDDELDSLTLLRAVLEDAGAIVISCTSGAEALGLIREHRPDVLVADVGMPVMDGLQFIRVIRQLDEPFRSIPAAALTAYARSQDRALALASGFQMHLAKPIDSAELRAAVASLAPGQVPQ